MTHIMSMISDNVNDKCVYCVFIAFLLSCQKGLRTLMVLLLWKRSWTALLSMMWTACPSMERQLMAHHSMTWMECPSREQMMIWMVFLVRMLTTLFIYLFYLSYTQLTLNRLNTSPYSNIERNILYSYIRISKCHGRCSKRNLFWKKILFFFSSLVDQKPGFKVAPSKWEAVDGAALEAQGWFRLHLSYHRNLSYHLLCTS